ncbi:MAG: glycosyltransferase family 39 protein [Anaerolineales bacterium]|nr:glycosyltransferase family 39 protein [Anaerolineales bacterium]
MQNKFRNLPFYLLLTSLLLIGIFTFKSYGLSWDEPLYYDYGKSSYYAYSISARLNHTFDIEKSFGKSPSDHVTRGPAYLLLAGLLENIFERLGLDLASAWHLTNFLTYLIGLTFFYALARLFLDPLPATLSTAFFAAQPVLWNHAFINPKDMPFSVFFLGAMFFGLRMIDAWDEKPKWTQTILAGVLLGVTTSIRFIAPYIVFLLFIYFITKKNWKAVWLFVPYGFIAIVSMIALWPFLWSNPIEKFIFTLQAMSETSANLKMLFIGKEFTGYDLPRRYIPTLFAITFTEPTWLLFFIGLCTAAYQSLKQKLDWKKPLIVFLWFGIILTLLIGLNPPNADGYRHYLFILPPIFIFIGFGIDQVLKRLNAQWLKYGFAVLILLPAIYNNILLHPYQYTYYNSFVGGTTSAFRNYETDYWLTCYKEAVEQFNQQAAENAVLFVKREPYIAAYYARPDIAILDFRTDLNQAKSGDYILINSRNNEDLKTMKDAPVILEAGRDGALFCVIKQIP